MPRSGWPWSASKPESLGHFMWVNRTLCEIAGLSKERLLGLHVAAIASDEDVASATAGIRRLLADDESVYSTERRYARPDGSVVWVELHMSLIRDESGDPLNFLAQVVDLTERKQAEEPPGAPGRDRRVLRGRDRRPGPRRDDRQLEPGRRAPLRYPAAEVVGKPISLLVTEDRSSELDGIPERIRRGERIENLETVHKDENGRLDRRVALDVAGDRARRPGQRRRRDRPGHHRAQGVRGTAPVPGRSRRADRVSSTAGGSSTRSRTTSTW